MRSMHSVLRQNSCRQRSGVRNEWRVKQRNGTKNTICRCDSSPSIWIDAECGSADYIDDEQIQELLHWTPSSNDSEFTDGEQETMLRLPRRECEPLDLRDEDCSDILVVDLLDERASNQLDVALISVLFSHAYELRQTQGEPTSESAWTVSVITPAFVSLTLESSLHETLVASYRRVLCFPLYRSFALCAKVQQDVVALLNRGPLAVLRALLEVKKILDAHEVYYVYAKIWVDDLCVWLSRHRKYASSLLACVSDTRFSSAPQSWSSYPRS